MFPGQRNVFVTQQKDKLLGIGAAGANACFFEQKLKTNGELCCIIYLK